MVLDGPEKYVATPKIERWRSYIYIYRVASVYMDPIHGVVYRALHIELYL